MKAARDMTLAEVEYLFHSHEFPAEAERIKALASFIEIIRIIDFIEERIAATPTLPCDCAYCDEIRNRKPKRAPKVPDKKSEPIHFSLDD